MTTSSFPRKLGVGRTGSVDSETIIALLDSISDSMDLPLFGEHLFKISKAVIGSYAILYVNPALPHSLFLLKYKNSDSMHWDSELGAFFSSPHLFPGKNSGRLGNYAPQEGPTHV